MADMSSPREQHCFTITTEEADGVMVLSATGEIDLEGAPALLAALDNVDHQRHVVVDMSAVAFMDSTGLSIIIRQSMRKRDAGGSLLLRNPAPTVRRLLEFCCLDHLIQPAS